MNWKRLTVVALAALLVAGGTAAAAPGSAPDRGDDHSEAGPPGGIGPPGGLLEPVPDFVGDLLDRIAQGVDGLGEAIADVVPGGEDTPAPN